MEAIYIHLLDSNILMDEDCGDEDHEGTIDNLSSPQPLTEVTFLRDKSDNEPPVKVSPLLVKKNLPKNLMNEF